MITQHYQELVLARAANDMRFVSLHNGDPGDGGENEVAGEEYSRQSVDWGDPEGGTLLSSNDLDYDDMPATRLTHMGLWDKPTGGRMLWSGPLEFDTPEDLARGANEVRHRDTVRIHARKLQVTID